MSDKTHAPKQANILAASGLSGKSITGVNAYQVGSTTVLEMSYSGGSQFVKVKGGIIEFGGTADWDSGTKVNL